MSVVYSAKTFQERKLVVTCSVNLRRGIQFHCLYGLEIQLQN